MAAPIPNEAPRPPLQDAQARTPIAYQVHDAAAQTVEALRAPAQTAASATSGFWSNFWSGLQGSQWLPRAENPGLGQIRASGYDFQPAAAASAYRHHLLRPPPPRHKYPLCRRGEPKAQLHQVMQC